MAKIVNKKKFICGMSILLLAFTGMILLLVILIKGAIEIFSKQEEAQTAQLEIENTVAASTSEVQTNKKETKQVEIPWNLMLVNQEHRVDRSYVPELEEIDDGILFDKRAIGELKRMINAMYQDGIKNIWVQSAYRSYEKQEELFQKKVEDYKKQGKEQEEAEKLAQTIVQRPEMSEHNLGLAADFNTVTNEFEKTKAFTWLTKHAQEYGFILRYPKEKQEITGITYESWHWRYVGKEHATIMKEKGYCLEEYIQALETIEFV